MLENGTKSADTEVRGTCNCPNIKPWCCQHRITGVRHVSLARVRLREIESPFKEHFSTSLSMLCPRHCLDDHVGVRMIQPVEGEAANSGTKKKP